ncbi:hypothetical protein C8A01DRAFT_41991 [Parachaetomium inaequale]|uniref:Uncharacterized protein n=1 Tax=Parachaetomium inaequale TaxID=2588326 RepID=A0AAN6SKC3_9PEZI|nr:hypothetical protein C8A01DRAFT_41991 [Parachaetomium inaequale]
MEAFARLKARVNQGGPIPSPWFPFPFYVDRDRTPKLTAASMDSSVVAGNGFNRPEVTGLNVRHESDGQVVLNVPLERVAQFKAAMLRRRLAAPEFVEDGLLVMLNSTNSARFFKAASQGQHMDLTLQPGGAFSKVSATARTLYTSRPAGGSSAQRQKQEGHVQTSVVLLRALQSGKANVDLMARFIRKAELAVIAAIPAARPVLLPDGCGIAAKFRIPKIDENSFAVQGMFPSRAAVQESSGLLNRLQEVVQGLKVPEGIVYGDYIEFQLMFAGWGFD